MRASKVGYSDANLSTMIRCDNLLDDKLVADDVGEDRISELRAETGKLEHVDAQSRERIDKRRPTDRPVSALDNVDR
ncbi:hypothetical protein PSO31014_01329 [Pandoraea soli]|uniref:Integrase n=1 Tax=Pandoraea soli TaxID=2508293 RepID=A0ABY6VT49_9BURK|nr:hypothetical protein PSO31014_01329 [Pandoraea soli]